MYAATGNEGKIIKIDPAGKASTFFKTGEIAVQTLAVDRSDNVYAATSPDGKIYKISQEGVSSVFFDPDESTSGVWRLMTRATCTRAPEMRARFTRLTRRERKDVR